MNVYLYLFNPRRCVLVRLGLKETEFVLFSSFAELDIQRPPQLFELCSLPAVGAYRLWARAWARAWAHTPLGG